MLLFPFCPFDITALYTAALPYSTGENNLHLLFVFLSLCTEHDHHSPKQMTYPSLIFVWELTRCKSANLACVQK